MKRLRGVLISLILAIIACITWNYSAHGGIEDDIVSMWDMNEIGGIRYDTYNRHDLTDNNTVQSASGILSRSALFDDANSEYLSHPDTDTLSFDSDFTLLAWVWLSSTQSQQYESIIRKWDNVASQREYHLYLNNRVLKFDAAPTGVPASVSAGAITSQTWHFIAAWMTTSTLYIQMDDTTVYTTAHVGGNLQNTTATFQISDLYDGVTGKIDNVRIYSRTLSALERNDIYLADQGYRYEPSGSEFHIAYMPLIMNNYKYTGDPNITGPGQEDTSWWEWAQDFDGFLAPIFQQIGLVRQGLEELLALGCEVQGVFAGSADMLEFNDNQSVQEIAYNLGIAIGRPIGLLRGFAASGMAPLNFMSLLLNFLLAGVVWISFVALFAYSVRFVRAAIAFLRLIVDYALELWQSIPFI